MENLWKHESEKNHSADEARLGQNHFSPTTQLPLYQKKKNSTFYHHLLEVHG